jgi:energy-coupling factor transporter ATP-binding protein EcfA2
VEVTTETSGSDQIALSGATLAWPVSEDAADSPESVHVFNMRDMTLEIPPGQFTLVCGPLGSGKTLLVSLQPVATADSSSELCWAKHASKQGQCWRPVANLTRRPCTARTSVVCGRMRAGSMNLSRTRRSRRTSVMGRYGTTFSLVSPYGRRGIRRFFGNAPLCPIWLSCQTVISQKSASTA